MNETVEQDKKETTALAVSQANLDTLKRESIEIINQVIAEQDIEKTKDLTYLFNINQNKKTMARVNKLNDLLDVITDQAIVRFTEKPDNISNQELIQSLKVVQDMVERGQKQVTGVTEQPLIQINQQTNELNVGTPDSFTKDSREKVKNAVMSILSGLGVDNAVMSPAQEDIIDITPENNDSTGDNANGNR